MLRALYSLFIVLVAAACASFHVDDDRLGEQKSFYQIRFMADSGPVFDQERAYKQDFEQQMQRLEERWQGCYEAELEQVANVTGEVRLHFKIAESGNAYDATIVASELSPEFTRECVLNELRGFAFPIFESWEYVEVSYPASFSYYTEVVNVAPEQTSQPVGEAASNDAIDGKSIEQTKESAEKIKRKRKKRRRATFFQEF